MKLTTTRLLILITLAVGVILFFAIPKEDWIRSEDDAVIQQTTLAIAGILALIPMSRKAIAAAFEWFRYPSPSRRRWTAVVIAITAGPLLFALGNMRGRLMLPIWHDESMYRMQTTFLAHGHFCISGLPLPDFFESPYIFVHDVYAPVYFPGTALLHVPAAWMHLPYWFTPLVIATVSLVLLYLIVTDLLDGLAGLTAVVLMISLVTFRWFALVEMSHAAGMMWGLIALWAWLTWRRHYHVGWAIVAGVAAGFYGITRPLDAICVLAPIAVAWIWDLRKLRGGEVLKTIVVTTLAAMPLIALQLAFDRALTGSVFQTPLDLYNKTFFNAKSLGLQHPINPSFLPPTPILQIKKLYLELDRPQMAAFTTMRSAIHGWLTERLPMTWAMTMPSPYLLILLPVALLGLTDLRRWVFWLMSWGFLIGIGFFYIFGSHYTISAAPAVIFALLLAVSVIQRAWPNNGVTTVFLPLAVLFLAIDVIAVNRQNVFEPMPGSDPRLGWVSRFNYHKIPENVKTPALVFFRFPPKEDLWEEPVYNWSVVNPDDATIIRAHDMGAGRDVELLRYYQTKRPDLHVYLFDRASLKLNSLGDLDAALKQMETTRNVPAMSCVLDPTHPPF